MPFTSPLAGGGFVLSGPVGPPGQSIQGPPGPPGAASTVPGPAGPAGPAGSPTTQNYQPVFDADYAAKATDGQIGFRTLTAQRTVYFPDVDTYPFNQDFIVADESGQCSPDRPILMAPSLDSGDQIGDGTQIGISGPNQGLRFRRGGVNLWILV